MDFSGKLNQELRSLWIKKIVGEPKLKIFTATPLFEME